MSARALLAVLAVPAMLVAAGPAAGAPALHLKDLGRASTVVGDGRAVAIQRAYSAAPDLSPTPSVVEVRTPGSPRVRRFTAPAGCGLADFASGVILWSCTASEATFSSGLTADVTSGARRSLPLVDRRPGIDDDRSAYVAVGARWAEARVTQYHGSSLFLIDRGTGAVMQEEHANDRSVVTDLDATTPYRSLCAPVRRPIVPDPDFPIDTTVGPLAIAGTYAADLFAAQDGSTPRIELQHCGTPARTLQVCPAAECDAPALDRRWIVWTETLEHGFALRIRAVRGGPIQTFALPADAYDLTLTGDDLYLLSVGIASPRLKMVDLRRTR